MPPLQQSNEILIALFLLQGLWGLFLIILTWAMRRVLRDIEENTRETGKLTESVGGLQTLLAGNYVTKPEYDRLELRIRETERDVTALRERDSMHHEVMMATLRKGDRERS